MEAALSREAGDGGSRRACEASGNPRADGGRVRREATCGCGSVRGPDINKTLKTAVGCLGSGCL